MVYSKDRELYSLKLLPVLEGNMSKKLFFLLAAALAVLMLGISCGGDGDGDGEEKKGEDFVTVTFDKNIANANPDFIDSDIEIDPPAIKVRKGEAIGAGNMPKVPPAEENGWGAGYSITGWNTAPIRADGKAFNYRTSVNENITVYAMWGFDQSQRFEGDGDNKKLVVIAPKIESSNGNDHSTFDGDPAEDNLSITWWNGAIRWAFPEEATPQDYDFVDIQYVGKGATEAASTFTSSDMKQYNGGGYTPHKIGTGSGNAYPDLPKNGTLTYVVRDATGSTRGVAIRANNNSGTVNKTTYQRTIKFTKATFYKGTRYKITFDLGYEGAPIVEAGFGIQGLAIGNLLLTEKYPLQSKPGSSFEGWLNSANNAAVTASTIVNGPLDLKANWGIPVTVDLFTVDFNNTNTKLTAVGSGTKAIAKTFEDEEDSDGGSGYTFTYGSGAYPSSWAKFTVTLPTGANLAAIKEVTFEGRGIIGDTANKPFALLAASPLPSSFSSDPHVEGSAYKINSNNPFPGNDYIQDKWKKVTFEIDKPKASSLKGTIEFCIYDHSDSKSGDDFTTWEIKNVTFIPVD
jgi:hypothetical protein